MTGFSGKLILNPTPAGNKYTLMNEYGFTTSEGELIIVPAGYVTDFASIPRFFWRILPPFGPYTRAAVIHDYLCDARDRPSTEVHSIFNEAMHDLGVARWKREVMYAAVRCCGPKF